MPPTYWTPTAAPRETITADPAPVVLPPPKAGSALALLARLKTADPGPVTGFSRARFGAIDLDVDGNGCDTRNDVLRRDMTKLVLAAKSNGCSVLRGSLRDPYTGKTIAYVRGPKTSKAVQVDYVVPLREAWRSGAAAWTASKRAAFANDSLDLVAVDAAAARERASEPPGWQPANKAYRCAFAARQITVKARYGLSVDARERATLEFVLRPCRDELATKTVPFRLGGGREEKSPQQIANEKAKAAAEAKAAANARAKAEARARAKAARVKARAAAAAQAKARALATAQAKAAARAKARAAAKAKAKAAAAAKAKAAAAAKAKAAAAAKAKATATQSN
ncbi:DUF1524 domain-containing protein [Terrabacter sp. NPDC000476]|uniref:GmrSD restriction endonuclease domain-containing protein n=1 Tax=Terrabacter sp. NPDC000476 TaxID=3154258 RepID=UPI003326DECB